MSDRNEFAVTITAPEQAELLPVEPDPAPLGPREVRGRTLVTLISAGTELAAAYQGSSFPSTPGYAAVFQAEEMGDRVDDLEPGSIVFGMGPHRSYQRVARDAAIPVPAGLRPQQAVFARMMGVTMSTLTTTAARPPETVLVTGLGLVGHLGALIFQACGYRVIGCDPAPARQEFARRAGIQTVLPAAPIDDPAVAGRVGLALECSGHEQGALDACRTVRLRGEVVLVGTPWTRRTDLTAHELLHAIFHRYVVVRSGWEWELPLHPSPFRVNSIYGNLEAALEWLADGRVQVDHLYRAVPPRDAQQAYQDLLHQRGDRLATVFDWQDCP